MFAGFPFSSVAFTVLVEPEKTDEAAAIDGETLVEGAAESTEDQAKTEEGKDKAAKPSDDKAKSAKPSNDKAKSAPTDKSKAASKEAKKK